MKIIHFDCVHGIDEAFINESDTYIFTSFNEQFSSADESVETVTCMHSSKIGPAIRTCFPNLHTVITRTVGTDHIDKEFCEKSGINYFSVGQYGPHVIAAHAFSLLLSGVRDLQGCRKMIEGGSYDYSSLRAIDLAGKTMGVVGVGNIGKHILRLAHAFGMKLRGYDMYEDKAFANEVGLSYVPLDELLVHSDVICLACNLTEVNQHMINSDAISRMKSGVILINIARGELIDEEALLAAIERFAFIGLDVITEESVDGLAKFLPYKNILITPHTAHLADSTIRVRWEKTSEIIKNL